MLCENSSGNDRNRKPSKEKLVDIFIPVDRVRLSGGGADDRL